MHRGSEKEFNEQFYVHGSVREEELPQSSTPLSAIFAGRIRGKDAVEFADKWLKEIKPNK